MSKQEELKAIWKAAGYPAAGKLWEILKKNGVSRSFTRKEVDTYIASQAVSQLHHKPVKQKHSHITTTSPGVFYNVDLLDMTDVAGANGGNKWLLLCIDTFSRRAVIVPLKNKTAATTADALKQAFREMGKIPQVVLSDQGSEFKGATASFLSRNHVLHRVAEVGDHNRLGLVDRFSQTVKRWIAKHMTHEQTRKYLDVLPGMLKVYNESPHSVFGELSPNEAWKFPMETRHIHYERIQKGLKKKTGSKRQATLEVGDTVRILALKSVFDKGYRVKFSLTTHKIVAKQGLNYVLDNGKFYRASRLLRVAEEDAQPVEDVAKKARKERRRDVILQTEGIKQSNRREGLRSRVPTEQVEDVRYGRVHW